MKPLPLQLLPLLRPPMLRTQMVHPPLATMMSQLPSPLLPLTPTGCGASLLRCAGGQLQLYDLYEACIRDLAQLNIPLLLPSSPLLLPAVSSSATGAGN